MAIEQSFLQDEVRDGFYIPANIKQCWAVELDILEAIDLLCEKYNIKYYAKYGTLLGAIRHRGYIPWDDDLDIGMFRTDLEKFLSVANELPDGYAVHCYKNTPSITNFIYVVVNSERINLTPDYLYNNHGLPYIGGIDIFVMDNVSDSKEEEHRRCTIANYTIQVADAIFAGDILYQEAIETIRKIESITSERVNPDLYLSSTVHNVSLRIRLYEIAEKLFTLFNNEDTTHICQVMPWGLNGERHYPREYYDELIRIPFENTTIPVPARYNSILYNCYGDYMRLVKNMSAHGYPCIATQRDSLKEQIISNMGSDAYNSFFSDYSFSKKNKEILSNNRAVDVNNFEGKVVIFMPFSGKYWSAFDAEYRKAIGSNNCQAYIIPIPYYYKDFVTKELYNERLDIDDYPSDLELYDWKTIDIDSIHPDRIYIQSPYDEYNPITSIHPLFYSSRLKDITDELIYIPWMELDDYDSQEVRSYLNMNSYVTMPAVINSDVVIVHSNALRDIYVSKLNEWAGCSNSISWSKIVISDSSHQEISLNNNERKYIMYYIGLAQLIEGGQKMIGKMQRIFSTANEYRHKVNLYVKVDSTFESHLASLDPSLFASFISLINPIKNDPDWLYDNSDYIDESVNHCSSFFGDAGYMANLFRQQNKPYIIQNIDVYDSSDLMPLI